MFPAVKMICEVFAVKEAAVRYVSLTQTAGDHLQDILANEGGTDSHALQQIYHSLFQRMSLLV